MSNGRAADDRIGAGHHGVVGGRGGGRSGHRVRRVHRGTRPVVGARADQPFAGGRAMAVRCEPGVGGRLLEVYEDDALELGRITAWEPGKRLAWRSSVDDVNIDVSFAPAGDGCLVRVEASVPAGGQDRGGTAWVRVTPKWFGPWCARRDSAPHRCVIWPGWPWAFPTPGRPRPQVAGQRVRLHIARSAARGQRPAARERARPSVDRVPPRQQLADDLQARRGRYGPVHRSTRRGSTSTTSTRTMRAPGPPGRRS